jgi:hypothetical protein
MITGTLRSHTIQVSDYSDDLSALRRLLVAAAISSQFRTTLLENPGSAVRQGYGGETFLLSDSTLGLVSSIQASNLAEFIQRMNENIPIL